MEATRTHTAAVRGTALAVASTPTPLLGIPILLLLTLPGPKTQDLMLCPSLGKRELPCAPSWLRWQVGLRFLIVMCKDELEKRSPRSMRVRVGS